MPKHTAEEPTTDLERCRHGFTAAEDCAICDEIDLRDAVDVTAGTP